MTAEQIMLLPIGKSVRIKDVVECHEMYKDWGKLTFQADENCEDHEKCYGILINGVACFEFDAKDYVTFD